MKWLAIAVVALALAGCAANVVSRKEAGEQTVGDRLVVSLSGPWNAVNAPGMVGPAHTWTMEGLPLDQLRIYSGIRNGESIYTAPSAQGGKSIDFRSGMRPDEIVAMFESMLTRDGSTFKLEKLEPWNFAGDKGFRFEFTFTRKFDGVVNLGIGYGTVNKGELFALLYAAPRMGFFPRHKDKVEQIARSARLKA